MGDAEQKSRSSSTSSVSSTALSSSRRASLEAKIDPETKRLADYIEIQIKNSVDIYTQEVNRRID